MAARCHVDQKSSSMNLFSGLLNRVHWTRFVSAENEFKELGLLKTPVTHPYTFKKTYTVIIPSHSRSLSHSLTLLSLSLSLTLALTLWLSSVSVIVAVAVAPSPLPSLSLACRMSYKSKLRKTASSPLPSPSLSLACRLSQHLPCFFLNTVCAFSLLFFLNFVFYNLLYFSFDGIRIPWNEKYEFYDYLMIRVTNLAWQWWWSYA